MKIKITPEAFFDILKKAQVPYSFVPVKQEAFCLIHMELESPDWVGPLPSFSHQLMNDGSLKTNFYLELDQPGQAL